VRASLRKRVAEGGVRFRSCVVSDIFPEMEVVTRRREAVADISEY